MGLADAMARLYQQREEWERQKPYIQAQAELMNAQAEAAKNKNKLFEQLAKIWDKSGMGEQVEKQQAQKQLQGQTQAPQGRSLLDMMVKNPEMAAVVKSMGGPDFVPAMKRAVAILTDRGGGTAHAAIVSRELGIPCVVGAEGATATLTDEQVITVDG